MQRYASTADDALASLGLHQDLSGPVRPRPRVPVGQTRRCWRYV